VQFITRRRAFASTLLSEKTMQLNPSALRLGTETAFSVLARAGQLASAGRDIVNLGIGQPDFPTPPHIVEAAVKALRDGAHGYTPAPGLPDLRAAVAADLTSRSGQMVDPGLVQILPGAKPVMFFASMLLGGPGREILLPDPGFPIYSSAAAYSGAQPVCYPLVEENGFAFTAESVLSRLTERTSLIILNAPANPTGGVNDRGEIDKLIKGLENYPDVMLLSDEIYDRLVFSGQHSSLLSWPELAGRLILLNGWSKSYAMTGWRIGYAVWPPSLFDYADRLAINIHSCVNAAAQYAALAATTGDQSAVEEMRQAFARRAELITGRLNAIDRISCQAPKGAFYAFANISQTGLSSEAFQDQLLEDYAVATVAGTAFGQMGEGFLRLSSASSDAAIETACTRLAEMVAKLN